MAILIRWQYDGCNFVPAEGYDKWWTDMHIDGQLQCERALGFTGKGEPCMVIDGDKEYRVDLVKMTQQNMKTGRIRPIRRTVTLNFSVHTHYFNEGRIRKRRAADPPADPAQRNLLRALEDSRKERGQNGNIAKPGNPLPAKS